MGLVGQGSQELRTACSPEMARQQGKCRVWEGEWDVCTPLLPVRHVDDTMGPPWQHGATSPWRSVHDVASSRKLLASPRSHDDKVSSRGHLSFFLFLLVSTHLTARSFDRPWLPRSERRSASLPAWVSLSLSQRDPHAALFPLCTLSAPTWFRFPRVFRLLFSRLVFFFTAERVLGWHSAQLSHHCLLSSPFIPLCSVILSGPPRPSLQKPSRLPSPSRPLLRAPVEETARRAGKRKRDPPCAHRCRNGTPTEQFRALANLEKKKEAGTAWEKRAGAGRRRGRRRGHRGARTSATSAPGAAGLSPATRPPPHAPSCGHPRTQMRMYRCACANACISGVQGPKSRRRRGHADCIDLIA